MKRLSLVLMILSVSAYGQTTEWVNPACAQGACEVRKVSLKLVSSVSKDSAGTSMVAQFETTEPEQLRKYAFVQYLKGCMFESKVSGPTELMSRQYFGRAMQPFVHHGWEVDSGPDVDPIYWSTLNPGWDELRGFEIPRNANYMSSEPTSSQYGWAGKVSNLKGRGLFISDDPTRSSLSTNGQGEKIAKNSSLQFRLCLLEIKQIPVEVTPQTILPDPIVCFDWKSNYVYDFSLKRFSARSGLHPFCRPEAM